MGLVDLRVWLRVCGKWRVWGAGGAQKGFLWLGEAARACWVEKRASRAWWAGHNLLILLNIFRQTI